MATGSIPTVEQEERPIARVRMALKRRRPFAFSHDQYSFVLAIRDTRAPVPKLASQPVV
jgi:hypothetical protein